MPSIRNFEPDFRWSNPDGTLTERAKGFLRSLFDYIGAGAGVIPGGSIGIPNNTTTFYRGDGSFAVPAYPVGANPSGSVGLTTVNGSASTFLRSDGAPAINLAITPSWTGAHAFGAGITGTTLAFTGAVSGDSLTATNGFGCNGQSAQTAVSIGAAVVGTAATNITPYGYATQAQADDIVTRLNTIRAALVSNGILA